MKQFREQKYVIRFLKGFNDRFTHTKSQMMAMDPLLTVSKAFSLILQQERELLSNGSIASETYENVKALAVNAPKNTSTNGSHGQGRGKNFYANKDSTGHNRVCTHCGKSNHTIDTCFLLHGFPPGYKPKVKSQANSAQTAAPSTQQNHAYVAQQQPSQQQAHQFSGFTQEQFQGILTLIQQSQPSHSSSKSEVHQSNSVMIHHFAFNCDSNKTNGNNFFVWLLDTGATDHISSHFQSFTSFHSIKPVLVSLPNDNTIFAFVSGTVQLTPTLILHNVLYIPDFSVNLVTVAKLISTNNCYLQFTDCVCHIVQNTSKKTIGTTSLVGGLYVIAAGPSLANNHSCNSVFNDCFDV